MDDSVTFIIDFLSANLVGDVKFDILDNEFESIKVLEFSEKKVRNFTQPLPIHPPSSLPNPSFLRNITPIPPSLSFYFPSQTFFVFFLISIKLKG